MILRVFTLTLLFCAALVTARVVGSSQPSPLDRYFNDEQGMLCTQPCLLGIRPGSQPLETIRQQFVAHPSLGNATEYILGPGLVVFNLPEAVVMLNNATTPVTSITFVEHLTLAELIAKLGAPHEIYVPYVANRTMLLVWDKNYLVAETRQTQQGRLSYGIDVVSLKFSVEGFQVLEPGYHWRGFAALSHYR